MNTSPGKMSLKLRSPLARNRFAHRMIVLFLAAGVLPVAILGAVSLAYLQREAEDQAYAGLHQAASFTGLALSDRLNTLVQRLEEAAAPLRAGAVHYPADAPWWGPAVADAFLEVAVLDADAADPALTEAERDTLAEGKTVLRTRRGADGGSDVDLLRALDPGRPDGRVVMGRANPERIWIVEDVMPRSTGVCVLDGAVPLFCTLPHPDRLAAEVSERAAGHHVGRMAFEENGEPYLANHWSLFMAARFGVPPWQIVVAEPRAGALAAVRGTAMLDLPALAVIALIATLVVLLVVRTRLTPLERLREATARIARGDLGQRVDIASGDEFQELGERFNGMAERLQRQFNGLAVRAEIDRLILSSLDARHIVSTVLNRMHDLFDCHTVGMVTAEGPDPATARLSVRLPGAATQPPDETIPLAHDALALLLAHPDGLVAHAGDPGTGFLEAQRALGSRRFLVLPIIHEGHLAAALIVGHAEPAAGEVADDAPDDAPKDAEDMRELREFADRIEVALSNAAWEDKLYRQAHFDALTGLPNRVLMRDRVERAILRAERHGTHVALLFLDLDRFKAVNDSVSHARGDALLQRVADSLGQCVRETDTVARFGGDEFIIALPDLPPGEEGERAVMGVVERVLESTREPVVAHGYRMDVTASIGVAVYPRDADDFDTLLRNADLAMYAAKGSGKGSHRFYSSELNAAAVERLVLEQELQLAIQEAQFRVYYQPQVDAADGRIVGAEALVRWEHPEKGLISPGIFVPVAEETGLIAPIGEWVMRTAATQLKAWRDAGLPVQRIGVNVAPQQLADDGFADTVRRVLDESGLAPEHLDLEVTEGALMKNTDRTIALLTELREMGVRLSVDDFGTGYSSLGYLQRFPLNTLKVDQSFTRNMVEEQDSAAIAEAVIALAHVLGLTVIAEGVETREQWDRLRELGCEELQGYLFSRPVPTEDFARYVGESGRLAA
jgi:diguanylate cyclase (GGDEF)-like protein